MTFEATGICRPCGSNTAIRDGRPSVPPIAPVDGTVVGLELDGNETAGHGDCVLLGRSQVGVITSGTGSPILRKNIALCRMATEHSEIGAKVEVGKLDGHRKRIPAQVVRFPFYDPDKTSPGPDRPFRPERASLRAAEVAS